MGAALGFAGAIYLMIRGMRSYISSEDALPDREHKS